MKHIFFVIFFFLVISAKARPPMDLHHILDSTTRECSLSSFKLLWQFDSCGDNKIRLNIFSFYPDDLLYGLSYERMINILGSPIRFDNYEYGDNKGIQAYYMLHCDSTKCCTSELINFFKKNNSIDFWQKFGDLTVLEVYVINGFVDTYTIVKDLR